MIDADAHNLAMLEELKVHGGYQLVRQRLSTELERQLKDLEADKDPIETAKIRGSVKMLRLALGIREKLEQEQREALRRDEKG